MELHQQMGVTAFVASWIAKQASENPACNSTAVTAEIQNHVKGTRCCVPDSRHEIHLNKGHSFKLMGGIEYIHT